ncbi:MAG: bifunctional cytidylyltransferase/SDR family oxidoreductase [Parachlamydiales bacterium]|nr:bifunctional cytidylyltransferase/SDR family oxidoreductase [Parachlamydiales bacterium]
MMQNMYNHQKITAILLMGGSGKRFDETTPKQFHRIAGQKIYLHTLCALLHTQFFDEIILVVSEKWIAEIQQEASSLSPIIRMIPGGKTRQESSYLGILAATSPIVLIHDAVRPFVSSSIIEENLTKVMQHGAVDTCILSSDTIIERDHWNMIQKIPSRAMMLRGQTPQTFFRSLIKKAHEAAQKKGIDNASDDCQLVLMLPEKVAIATGSEANIKITTPLDLFLAEQLWRIQATKSTPQALSLKDKIFALVGGSGGIGKAIDHYLQKEGAKTLIISRSSSFSADLRDHASVKKIFARIHREFGPIDGLINCAGILHTKPFKEHTLQEIETLISTNLTGLIFCCKYAILKKGGAIINIASSSFFKGRKDQSIYSATKAAVVNFTQALAEEFPNLLVNVVAPQRTNTPMRRKNFPDEDTSELLSPEHIAQEVLSILKDRRLTGSIIDIRNTREMPAHMAHEELFSREN